MKTAIYARVSTQDQQCEMQLREIRQYLTARGWQVVAEYIDKGQSGTKASRPELDRMMKAAQRREFSCIAVWKIDRLGRSVSHLVQCISNFASWGVRFIAVTQNIDTDESNPMSRFMLHILAAFAEMERALIAERVTAGLKNAVSKGKRLGRPPVVIDRQRVRELRSEGKSLRQIADALGARKSTVERVLKAG